MEMTARSLLAFVFAQAREVLDRSPEQVGAALGMSGRTLRRLESPDDEQRPRRSTLQTLAGYYGLDSTFVTALADWDQLAGEDLASRLARAAGVDEDDAPAGEAALRARVLRLARGATARTLAAGGPLPPALAESEDWAALVELFLALDVRRRRLLVAVGRELAAAVAAEGAF